MLRNCVIHVCDRGYSYANDIDFNICFHLRFSVLAIREFLTEIFGEDFSKEICRVTGCELKQDRQFYLF